MSGAIGSSRSSRVHPQHPAYLPYMYFIICLGFFSIAQALYRMPGMGMGYQWLILAALTIFSSFCTVKIPSTNSKISIGDVFFFTNVILYGIPAGVITAALDALASSLRAGNRSRRLQYSLFNVAAMAVSAQLSGMTFFYLLERGPLRRAPAPSVLEMLVPLAALAFAHYLWNSASVAVIVALERRRSVFSIWKDSFLWTSITYFAGAAAAGIIALAIGSIAPQLLAVAVPILLAIYFTYKTYLDKVQQVSSLAYYDSLTMLPNRILFTEHLNQALTLSQSCNKMMAVMFLDLDNFKRINDSYGHGVGDALLRSVAARLTATLRIHDRDDLYQTGEKDAVIGRFGGDEFTLLVTGIDDPQEVTHVAQRLLQTFSSPFAVDGKEVMAGASIGISIYPLDGASADTLLKNADAAMFHAKDLGRLGFQFYSQSMNELSARKLELANDLRKAVDRGEFRLFYQPKVDVKTRSLIGAEALVRWQHPTKGLLGPAEFIPLAEETGLIRPLGEWVLLTACQHVSSWLQSGLAAVPVAVNLSTVQFRQQNLLEIISRILCETSLEPRYLELEITESMIMQDQEVVAATLRSLREFGLRISIDDFGTGYSSLSRLKRFTLDALKVDRSFVLELADNPDDKAITRAIVAMAHSLELKVIAEGVETEQQFNFLKSLGCDEIQGYLFGRPMPVEEFCRLLDVPGLPAISAAQPADLRFTGTVNSPRPGISSTRPNLRLVLPPRPTSSS